VSGFANCVLESIHVWNKGNQDRTKIINNKIPEELNYQLIIPMKKKEDQVFRFNP
jgi:hypothetical protein